MDRNVRDVMHRGVVSCLVSATVDKIAKIMLDNNVSALVVIDEHLNACGVVTKTNLIGLYGEDLSLTIAEDIMSPKLFTVSPATSVYDAIQLMLEQFTFTMQHYRYSLHGNCITRNTGACLGGV